MLNEYKKWLKTNNHAIFDSNNDSMLTRAELTKARDNIGLIFSSLLDEYQISTLIILTTSDIIKVSNMMKFKMQVISIIDRIFNSKFLRKYLLNYYHDEAIVDLSRSDFLTKLLFSSESDNGISGFNDSELMFIDICISAIDKIENSSK